MSDPGPAEVTPRTVDMRAVARVSNQVTIKAVRLRDVHAAVAEELRDIPPDWATKAFVVFDSGVGRQSADGAQLLVRCSFAALYLPGQDPATADFPEVDDDAMPSIDVEATFELEYEVDDAGALQDGDVEHFALVNGTFHAWPYWRELAQNATVRMGIPPLVVGTYKIPSTYDPGRQPAGD